jgi:2-dehydropantoate 2-reductase
MRTLVVGAGAIGGYFGGRLLEAQRDVTFLVRERRAAELASAGLRIRSRLGDATLSTPPTALAGDLAESFDLVLLSLKAYDLEEAMSSFAPAAAQWHAPPGYARRPFWKGAGVGWPMRDRRYTQRAA